MSNTINVHALIVAAGKGSRFQSSIPKQYIFVAGQRVVQHSVTRLSKSKYIHDCHLVVAKDDELADQLDWTLTIHLVTGGRERWQSVQAGMIAIANSGANTNDLILIHDAARPCVEPHDIDKVIEVANQEKYGAILAIPVADTIKKVDSDQLIQHTVNRECLWQAQTPQVFRLGYLQEVLAIMLKEGKHITDEASAFEQLGYDIRVVAGSRFNIKLTYPDDILLLGSLLSQKNVNVQHK